MHRGNKHYDNLDTMTCVWENVEPSFIYFIFFKRLASRNSELGRVVRSVSLFSEFGIGSPTSSFFETLVVRRTYNTTAAPTYPPLYGYCKTIRRESMLLSFAFLTGAAAVLLPLVNNNVVDAFSPPLVLKSQASTTASSFTNMRDNNNKDVTRRSRLDASSSSSSSVSPTPAGVTTAAEAKDNMRRALEASKGSTLGDDVLAAAEVSITSYFVCTKQECCT